MSVCDASTTKAMRGGCGVYRRIHMETYKHCTKSNW